MMTLLLGILLGAVIVFMLTLVNIPYVSDVAADLWSKAKSVVSPGGKQVTATIGDVVIVKRTGPQVSAAYARDSLPGGV